MKSNLKTLTYLTKLNSTKEAIRQEVSSFLFLNFFERWRQDFKSSTYNLSSISFSVYTEAEILRLDSSEINSDDDDENDVFIVGLDAEAFKDKISE